MCVRLGLFEQGASNKLFTEYINQKLHILVKLKGKFGTLHVAVQSALMVNVVNKSKRYTDPEDCVGFGGAVPTVPTCPRMHVNF